MILLRLFAKTIVYCMIVLMGILLIATTLYLFWASDVFPEVNEFLDNTTAVEMGSGTLGSLGDSASSLLGDAADTANSTLTAIVRLVPDELDQQIAAASVSGDMKTMMQARLGHAPHRIPHRLPHLSPRPPRYCRSPLG